MTLAVDVDELQIFAGKRRALGLPVVRTIAHFAKHVLSLMVRNTARFSRRYYSSQNNQLEWPQRQRGSLARSTLCPI